MRVGLNATCLNARPSGAKQRFLGLYGALIRRRPDIEFVIYEPSDWSAASELQPAPNVIFRSTPLPSTGRLRRTVGGLTYWRRQLANDRLDLFESFHLPLIKAPGCPTILTIHDARPIRSSVSGMGRRLQQAVLRHALRSADHVITVSHAMRRELLALQPSAAITTIHNGIDPAPFETASTALHFSFILAVGHFEPRKNYRSLLTAFKLLIRNRPSLDLVIVGKDNGDLAGTVGLVETLGLRSRVHIRTDVGDAELTRLYGSATILAFPSTYEGFGIPVLEAMAAGCPMCLSDIPVFRELTEDTGSYFSPMDPMSIAAVIASVLDSPTRMHDLGVYGRRRVADFSFAALAEQLDAIHRDLLTCTSTARSRRLHGRNS